MKTGSEAWSQAYAKALREMMWVHKVIHSCKTFTQWENAMRLLDRIEPHRGLGPVASSLIDNTRIAAEIKGTYLKLIS